MPSDLEVNATDLETFIFWSFGTIEVILGQFENKVLLKPVLGGATYLVHFIAGHKVGWLVVLGLTAL